MYTLFTVLLANSMQAIAREQQTTRQHRPAPPNVTIKA
jgi:hypothetical protein